MSFAAVKKTSICIVIGVSAVVIFGSANAQTSPQAKALAEEFVNQNRSPMDRLASLEKLRAIDPALAHKFEPTKQKLIPIATKQGEDVIRQLAAADSVMGISIGMTAANVRDAKYWGRPERVNSTTTPYGTREQWVYGGGRYVYFDRGLVTAIQHQPARQ